jgi:hypothetical protein
MNVEATNHYQYLSLFAMSPDDGDTWRLTPLFPSGTAVSQNYDHPNNAFAIGDDKLARAQWNGSSPVYVRQF